MIRKSFTLTNPQGEFIRGDLRYRQDLREAPVVVICHGFKGFKDWGFFPFICERLADDGYIAISFNFSRNGIGADPLNFTELEKFADNTYSHELSDLQTVLQTIRDGKLGNGLVDPDRIGLLGHSRGGGIVLLHAATDEEIKAVVTWSAISTVERYSQEQVEHWKQQGFIELENKRTRQIMRLNKTLLEDLEKNRSKLDILKAAGKLESPTLIIHGDADESVPVEEAQRIYDNLGSVERSLEIIEGASHTFGISHPMESRTKQFDTVLDLTESWFDRHMNY